MQDHNILVTIGRKVRVEGFERYGFGEIISYPNDNGIVSIAFYIGPDQYKKLDISLSTVIFKYILPRDTRCYFKENDIYRIGLIGKYIDINKNYLRKYNVFTPDDSKSRKLNEDNFHIRSFLSSADPIKTLSSLTHDEYRFFELRSKWIISYIRQLNLCEGLTGLVSAKINLMPHQVEIVKRVLQDSEIRYLLADEVGLGKTIETCIILNQLIIDFPKARIAVFAPSHLIQQWKEELYHKFELVNIGILSHGELLRIDFSSNKIDIAVIDEAHRICKTSSFHNNHNNIFQAACSLAKNTRHLLLLSATPVLYHEEELYYLLHLLNPEAYNLDDFPCFQERLKLRQEIGRTLLALENATQPLFIQRYVNSLVGIISGDEVLNNLSKNISDSFQHEKYDDGLAYAKNIQIHVSETYKVYRRMLRTRRSVLRDSGFIKVQRSEVSPSFEIENDLLSNLWGALEEWRIHAAAFALKTSIVEKEELISTYHFFAENLSLDISRFASIIEVRFNSPKIYEFEKIILEKMATLINAHDNKYYRTQTLLNIMNCTLSETKHVIFCSSSEVCEIVFNKLKNRFSLNTIICAHSQMSQYNIETNIDIFRREKICKFIIGDITIEEGYNFQFANSIIMYDLPINPMRIEQRIGRLDRIDRKKDISCKIILSLEDEYLALDTAWHLMLRTGFEIFNSSISDLQFLVEREMNRLRETIFYGGPAALISEIENVRKNIQKERMVTTEQDIIDGLHLGEIIDSTLWKNLQLSENEINDFGGAMRDYLEGCIGVTVIKDTNSGNIIRFSKKKNQYASLISWNKLILCLKGQTATLNRDLVVKYRSNDFIRVGHKFVEMIRYVSSLDERGRSFVLWRKFNGLKSPRILFRIIVNIELKIGRLKEICQIVGMDELLWKSIIRLLKGWFPTQIKDIFIDENCKIVDDQLILHCKKPYNRESDIDLCGFQSTIIDKYVDNLSWMSLCQQVSKAAIEMSIQDKDFLFIQKDAQKRAQEYFAKRISWIKSSRRQLTENSYSIDTEVKFEETLISLIKEIIGQPQITIDAFGAYILSEEPLC